MIEEELPEALVPVHMPAVREMLGSLAPEHLHPDLDKAVGKGKDAFGPLRGVSQLKIGGWGVSGTRACSRAHACKRKLRDFLFCC